MNIGKVIVMGALFGCVTAYGQGKENFLRQQAYAEMQRVSGQVDVLQNNLGDLQRRIGALEGGGNTKGIRQELDALKQSIAELRREMQSMRGEIVKDLSGKMVQIQKQMQPAPAPRQAEAKKVVIGPHQEYVVQSGDTLSLIAQAFGTSVSKIKEMNGLKNDNLRVGQKLNLPK